MLKRNRLFSRESFWLQMLVWGMVVFFPIIYMPPDEKVTLQRYLMRCPFALSIVTIFYLNYFWLAPRYLLVSGHQKKYWLLEIAIVCLLSLATNTWMSFVQELHRKDHPSHFAPNDDIHEGLYFLGFMRELYLISTTAALGCAIPVSRRWMEAEQARQQAEVARREAEIKILRNQVSPHFLLNTLNNIYALTAFDQKKAQEAVMHLSRMLRHLLYDDHQPFVNLKKETDFVHDYIDIMRIRYGSNVEVDEHIHIPEPCSIVIAPMIIITLVENAFKHGVSTMEPSRIQVSITAKKDEIIIDIINTNFPKSSRDKSGHGIGLTQVLNRLELDYHGKYLWKRGLTEDKKYYQSKIALYDTELHHH